MSVESLLYSKARMKILVVLIKFRELNISSIVRKTGLNHNLVNEHLEYFKNIGLVEEKNFGRIRIFRLNESEKVRLFRELIFSSEKS
ncbi:ArsR family transcriptional regulator [Candidatus Bathyarchaeota archaeon ex4484_205]|nr:MAG: ArsR family transcriptional regulator [Candidatus Bathyarchaeota archaeon ex4484_205]RLG66454.1 MAG: ArsR family transcriptional regulator [archaeon]HDN18216.1 ArsR family transcriptional regulator [Candidatus Bathyarchaeota archaeon]